MTEKKITDFLAAKGKFEVRTYKGNLKRIFCIEKVGTHGNYGILERISKKNGEKEKDLTSKVVDQKAMEHFIKYICHSLKEYGEPRKEKEMISYINIWFEEQKNFIN